MKPFYFQLFVCVSFFLRGCAHDDKLKRGSIDSVLESVCQTPEETEPANLCTSNDGRPVKNGPITDHDTSHRTFFYCFE